MKKIMKDNLHRQRENLIHQLRNQGILNKKILEAFSKVKREYFINENDFENAYINHPLPIGFGQTISQPYTVAFMTELLDPKLEENILEIGTGSGYQAAILAELGANVYSIERIKDLHFNAKEKFKNLSYTINLKLGNGYNGWIEHSPYDGIIVTAGSSNIPKELINQLKPGGRMVIPVGTSYSQEMYLIEKNDNDNISIKKFGEFIFVPLIEND